jgi:hypothetical protein
LGYLVSMSEDGSEWTLAYDGSTNFKQKIFKFQGLKSGSQYGFKVWSRNELGVSATSSPILEVYAGTYP